MWILWLLLLALFLIVVLYAMAATTLLKILNEKGVPMMKTYETPVIEEIKFASEAIADQGGENVSGIPGDL